MWPNKRNNKNTIENMGELEPQPPRHKSDRLLKSTGNVAIGGFLLPSPESSSDTETAAFDRLRTDTHQRMKQEIASRLSTNPNPTVAERNLGTYVENLEPQVRNATLTMRAKGYNSSASGFFGSDDDWRVLGIDNPSRTYHPNNRRAQVMDFREPFALTEEVSEQLNQLGVETPAYPGLDGMVVRIGFEPDTPDLGAIQAKWDAIADVLPDTGMPTPDAVGGFNSVAYDSGSATAAGIE